MCKSSKRADLNASKSKTGRQRQRGWSMRKAEELIKGKLKSNGVKGIVKYSATPELRKNTVNEISAFVQLRHDAQGQFQQDFNDLKLP